MTNLDCLIAELCPDGVEYRELCNCLIRTKGTKITAEQMQQLNKENAPVKIFAGGKTVAYFDYDDLPEDDIQTNPSVIVKSRGLVEFEYYDKPFSHKNEFWAYHSQNEYIDIKYVFYYLRNQESYFRNVAKSMGSLPQISIPVTEKFKIPLPPLPIQQEIVRILDKFTALEAELEAELEARKKQYECYRDLLLNFDGQRDVAVQCMTLGEIGRVSMCKRIMKAETTPDGDVPFFKIGTFGREPDAYISQEKYDEYRKVYSFPKKGDILISAAGTIGRTVIYDGEPAYYQDSNIVWIDNDENKVLNKYLYYCYSMKPWMVSNGGTIARLYNDNINKTKITLPPLPIQQEIVSILDRFDTLVNDITQGLPAEIAARRKQYEYYRNKLLTFKEKVS